MKKFLALILVLLLLVGCGRRPFLQSSFPAGAQHPKKVALLLPLHGQYGASGRAIRNGFLAAYYYALAHGQSDLTVSFLDTSANSVEVLYQKAVADGCEFIVGPLIKQNLLTVYKLAPLKIPTLALNTLANYAQDNTANLYQFGLSATDEAQQLASRAWSQHPGRALIIAPQGEWGENLAQTLQNSWQGFGGEVAQTLLYHPGSFNRDIAGVLNIALSRQDARQLRQIIGKKFKFTPRRRQDINVILLVAFPKDARQIKPLLNFYFAGDIPTYATSQLYSGVVQPRLDSDLDGIEFCDMPWVLQSAAELPPILPTLRQEIIKNWPSSYHSYSKLYALGIDAYYLMLNARELVAAASHGIDGATGMFYLDQYGHIYRRLLWAKMVNGRPQLLS